MDFVKRKFLRRNTSTSSEGDVVYQSWLLQLPPARGLKKYLCRSHWRWMVLRYTAPEEGVLEMYTNVSCTRMTSKIRITRKYKVESGMSFNPGGATNQLNMFSIRTERQVHYLVAETQAEAEQWVLAICTTCGLDIPRQPKSPSPPEFLSNHQNRRPRSKSESVPVKGKTPSVERNNSNRDSSYILLSECYVADESVDSVQLPKENKSPLTGSQGGILCLSSNNLSYDHPRPMHQRLRFPTSPDLSDHSPDPHQSGYLKQNYNHPRCPEKDNEMGGMRRLLNTANMHLPVVPVAPNCSRYDTPPPRVICVPRRTDVNSPKTDIELARAEARHAALELEETISRNSVTELLHGSVSPVSSEVFAPEFFPFDIHPDKPPPRPPKPPHLRHDANPWDSHMIQVDLACPIYDVVPKPRPVLSSTTSGGTGKLECNNISPDNDKIRETMKSKDSMKRRPFLHSVSSNIEIPALPQQQNSPATIKISPNTRVIRPAGGLCTGHSSCSYDIPKPQSNNVDSTNPLADVTKGVRMRRRPPTPPSQNLKHSIFPLDIDWAPPVDFSNKRRKSLTEKQVQPLTQKQRISICNEVNYLDLAFTADEGNCSPKPLTRETVYYSVDFIRTWAFNETRQHVEEIYRNP